MHYFQLFISIAWLKTRDVVLLQTQWKSVSVWPLELETNPREVWSCIMEKAFSWLKVPICAFTFKDLLRHYVKRLLTHKVDVKLGPRRKSHKGREVKYIHHGRRVSGCRGGCARRGGWWSGAASRASRTPPTPSPTSPATTPSTTATDSPSRPMSETDQ